MATNPLKKNAKVRYATPRGGQTGEGKITEVQETLRGLWYVVKDAATGAVVKLRARNVTVLA